MMVLCICRVPSFAKMDKKRIGEKLRPYVQAIPDIFSYQIVTKIVLAVLLFLMRGACLS